MHCKNQLKKSLIFVCYFKIRLEILFGVCDLANNYSRAEISSLVQSDSESDDCEQKQTVVKKQVVKKRERDESKWIRNIAKKGKAEEKSYIGIKNKNKCLKGERKAGKNCNCKFKCFTKINDNAKPPDCMWFYDQLKYQGEEESTPREEYNFTDY